ncbi:MAG: hypothetical protein AAF191_13305 [Verrucomicrobiota bacterium]
MIVLPSDKELTADQAAAEAKRAREQVDSQGEILLGYLNQIRAAHELGETSLITTCMTHELRWLAEELRDRGFQVDTEVHMMHGQVSIFWGAERSLDS